MVSGTMIQKIIATNIGRDSVEEGEIVFAKPHRILSHDNSAAISKTFIKMASKVWDPNRIFIVLDHAVPPPSEKLAANHTIIRNFVKKHNIKYFYDAGEGICHQVLPENGHVLPGTIIFGSDSHTTTHGAFGAAGIPIGRTETASIWAIGETWIKVPETIKFDLRGKFREGVYAKDAILHMIGEISASGATYKSLEFLGEAATRMTISERMTLANMGAEMGAKVAMFPYDEVTKSYLDTVTSEAYTPINPDPDAQYLEEHVIDFNDLVPVVAKPHKVDNVSPIGELPETEIDVAMLGTCTNGRLDDLANAARILKGKKVKQGVRLLIYPASRKVMLEAMDKGYIQILVEAGGQINTPACGPCLGAYGGVLAPNERAISSANRNFKGRMGCREAEVYLASPATVAASALAGKIVSEMEVSK